MLIQSRIEIVCIKSVNIYFKRSIANYGTGKENASLPCFELTLHDLLKSMFDP